MWVLKVALDAKKMFFGALAVKHKVAILGCPLSFSHKDKELVLQVNGVLIGELSNQNNFIEEIKKNPRVLALESKGGFVVASYKTPEISSWLDNNHLVHGAHLSVDFDGIEILTIESFHKTPLMLLLKLLKNKFSAELISISQQESSVIPVLRSSISLTAKQRFALELALQNGYYSHPRKTSVKKLAMIAKLSFSTFQQHLRKAESKLLPSL